MVTDERAVALSLVLGSGKMARDHTTRWGYRAYHAGPVAIRRSFSPLPAMPVCGVSNETNPLTLRALRSSISQLNLRHGARYHQSFILNAKAYCYRSSSVLKHCVI
jgi:hypothetical protein